MSALTTHTIGNQRKEKRKEMTKRKTPTSDQKPKKGKEQYHLKKTSLGPLRQGQRLNTSETKPCSSKKHKLPKHTRAPPAHMQTPPEQVPALGTNRSGRFPKPVRPVTKTGQASCQNQSDRFGTANHTPQKPKMQNKCTSSPLTLGIGFRDAMQLFSTFLSPPCCQCMNQGSNLKTCNLELLKYTKFITRCYTCPNEQVRYSTASQ
jgi:hypothetical protein